jgi:DNA/RNA-binding domain of Phe-tRNA-synthetase-like protein
MLIDLRVTLNDAEFAAGVAVAYQVSVGPSPPELSQRIEQLVARRAAEEFPPPNIRQAIRDMLRKGGFKPAGRNKPASEYLAQAAREGRFPRIDNLVDVNNLVSLESGLPISLLDLDAVGPRAEIRYGREGEKYVFNAAGQEIDLGGLMCLCRVDESGASTPLGNPIKDSMAGKLTPRTRNVVGVIYASTRAIDTPSLQRIAAEFATLLQQFGGAADAQNAVLR